MTLASRVADNPESLIEDGTAVTEDMVARCFAGIYARQLAYCHSRGAWFEFDGSTWKRHLTPVAFQYIRDMCRRLSARVKNGGSLQKLKFMSAIETLSQKERVFSRDASFWDADPMLLGTPGGTVDLRTGSLRQSRPEDAITKSVSVIPDDYEDCPTWHQFLEEACAGDHALVRFLQQVAGYCLTGLTTEQALFFIYGTGGNGKGVFIGAVQGILADYAQTAGMEMLEKQKFASHSTDLAALAGARAVIAAETEEGSDWNGKRVKQMTGGDRIKARFMRQDEFEYAPQFKLLISGNHEPSLQSVDDAMRRRFNIIPFVNTPKKQDLNLPDKLKSEWPGILRWMINGCLDWQRNGLVRPDVVLRATQDYFDDQNTIQQWLDELCVVEPDNTHLQATSTDLFKSWSAFARSNGLEPGTTKTFKPAMERSGYRLKKTSRANIYLGIELRANLRRDEADDDPFR